MPRAKKTSEALENIFGNADQMRISQKLVEKLAQYNMKYEEITKVILTHSERAFVDARLTTLEEYFQKIKKSEVEAFLESLIANNAAEDLRKNQKKRKNSV